VYPLVGTIRKQDDPIAIYVLAGYKTRESIPIQQQSIDTNNFLPYFLKHNKKIVPLLKECASRCHPTGHNADIRKLVAIPEESNIIFVAYVIKFSDKRLIILKRTVMSDLYHHVNSLESWESWMDRYDVVNFGLEGGTYDEL